MSRTRTPMDVILRMLLSAVLACGLMAAPMTIAKAYGEEVAPATPADGDGESPIEQDDGDSSSLGETGKDADGGTDAPKPLDTAADADAPGSSNAPSLPDLETGSIAQPLDASDDPVVGGPGEWALDKIYGIAFDLAETIVFDALNKAADQNDDEDVKRVILFMDGLLGGSGNVDNECAEILEEVKKLSNQITNLENTIAKQFNALAQQETLDEIEHERSEIVQTSDSVYKPALKAYQSFIKATEDYSSNIGNTNEPGYKKTAEDMERALVRSFDSLDYKRDLTTIETHGVNMGNYTNHRYLYKLNEYADEAFAFDHQRYALLTAGINDVVVNLNLIVYVQRLEYDYWQAKAANDPQNAELETKVADLGIDLKFNLDRVIEDINWVVSEYANKDGDAAWSRTDLLTLMRPYDFHTTYEFDYASSSNRTFKYVMPNGYTTYTSTHHYTATAVNTKPTMAVYRVAVQGTPYLVLDGNEGVSYGAKHGDLIHGVRYWEKILDHHFFSHDYYGFPDQDFFNLQSTKDGIYSLPSDFSPLAPFVNQSSYASSGGSLTAFFHNNGMTSIAKPPYILMNSYVDPAPHSGARAQNHYSSFNLYSTSISTTDGYDSAKKKLTMEDSAGDPGLLVVLSQNNGKRETYPLKVITEGSGLDIEVTDLAGTKMTGDIAAGTPLKLMVKAADGTALDSLVLNDASGTVLETLASAEAASLVEGSTNAYTFYMTMPYQEASLVGTPGQAAPNPLHFVEDEDGAYLISTLDDLKNVATAYELHPVLYQDATFRLAADIVNLRIPFPVWTVPIGTAEHPFTGTFNGAGHAIGGFTMDMSSGALASQQYGGLFGVIGKDGVVRDVAVSGIEYRGNDTSHAIGGLAGLNEGSIDNCSTGSAQTGFAPSSNMLTPDELSRLNVTVSSHDAGGLVAVNRGGILNCWSGADVAASSSGRGGGLVGYSESGSSVWNSYAMGDVLSGGNAGGLIGRNYADVHNTYYCGSRVQGDTAGAFVGANHHDVFASYTIEKAAAREFGSGYAGSSPEAGLTVLRKSQMLAQSFADQLNAEVTGAMDWWVCSNDENNGFPSLIKDPMIERTIVDEATGISLSGRIHAAAVLSIKQMTEDDATHRALYEHAAQNGLLGQIAASYRAFLPVASQKSGQTALEGTVTLKFPFDRKHQGADLTILQERAGGIVLIDAAEGDGFATVEIDTVAPFAVLANSEAPAEPVPPVPSDREPSNGIALAPTGDMPLGTVTTIALIALIAAAGAVAACVTFTARRASRKDRRHDA